MIMSAMLVRPVVPAPVCIQPNSMNCLTEAIGMGFREMVQSRLYIPTESSLQNMRE